MKEDNNNNKEMQEVEAKTQKAFLCSIFNEKLCFCYYATSFLHCKCLGGGFCVRLKPLSYGKEMHSQLIKGVDE